MVCSNPLGVMYVTLDCSGHSSFGFAVFRDQTLSIASHCNELPEILGEIIERGACPMMLKIVRQAEYFDLVNAFPAVA